MTNQDRLNHDRAASLVHETPIRHGSRLRPYPIEAYECEAFPVGRRAPHGTGFAFVILFTLSMAGAAYIVARFALSFL